MPLRLPMPREVKWSAAKDEGTQTRVDSALGETRIQPGRGWHMLSLGMPT